MTKTVVSGCGRAQDLSGLPPEVREKVSTHPCYSVEAHHHYARIHLPVAPKCNIQCQYCNRLYDCINESRPGVTSQVLSPEAAVERVAFALSKMPYITVVGIAGPGDILANPEKSFRTFELIAQRFPNLTLCLATNGLMLPEYVDTIAEYHISHVTITINQTDPKVGKEIYKWVYFQGQTYRDEAAAALLSQRQLEGLDGLVRKGVLVKVNTILIPGVNDRHIPQVVKEVKKRGAFLVNIMPLIPVKGTKFENHRAPTSAERRALQDACETDIHIMRHCRQCRSDAIGLLGQDRSQELVGAGVASSASVSAHDSLSASGASPAMGGSSEGSSGGADDGLRDLMLAAIAKKRERQQQMLAEIEGDEERKRQRRSMMVAVASGGGGVVNLHFGHAREFLIYQVSEKEIRFLEARNVDNFCHGSAECDNHEDNLEKIVSMLKDCQAVLSSRIGREPAERLAQAGIASYTTYDYIEKALDEVARGEMKPSWQ
ncbi:MAG: nitrogenase cofactor biosynthesis protein NifB [Chloroflexi bacterium]|nr:nitrogenase cofactor biosynthesis protein NifB [Chloroflexota bacterium]